MKLLEFTQRFKTEEDCEKYLKDKREESGLKMQRMRLQKDVLGYLATGCLTESCWRAPPTAQVSSTEPMVVRWDADNHKKK